jgi:hypothetical protein
LFLGYDKIVFNQTDDLLPALLEQRGGVDKIDKNTKFEDIRKIVHSHLNCFISVPIHLYNRLNDMDSTYTKANFKVLEPTEDNNLWIQVAAVAQLSPFKENPSEFDYTAKYDALIRAPLELILLNKFTHKSKIKINVTRNTCLSTNLNENLNFSNSQKQSKSNKPSSKSSPCLKDSATCVVAATGSNAAADLNAPIIEVNDASNLKTTQKRLKSNSSADSKKSSIAAPDSSASILDLLENSRKHLASKPDFAVFANKFLIFVGEEKSSDVLSSEASWQIRNILGHQSTRLPWSIFGNIPFVFGYTGCGNEVKLFYYTRNKTRRNLETYDITHSLDCVKLFIHMTNVARIILEFSRKLIEWPFEIDEHFFVGEHRSLGATVFRCLDGVVKVYDEGSDKYNIEKAKRVNDIYKFMKTHLPTLDGYALQCKNIDDTQSIEAPLYEFHFEPLCKPIRDSHFTEAGVKELLKALWCVLKVLVLMHKLEYVHGDIRWPNIMYDIVEEKYTVIDFDNGGKSPLRLSNDELLVKYYPLDEMKRNGEKVLIKM